MYKFLIVLLAGWICTAQASPILSKADITAYNKIWELHDKGMYTQAKKLQSDLKNKSLMGYVLFHKYFSRKYKTTKKEISSWMDNYSDLPIAPDMYLLGKKKNVKNLKRPTGLFGNRTRACDHPLRTEPIDLLKKINFSYLTGQQKKRAQKTLQKIISNLNKGNTLIARQLLNANSTIKTYSKHDIDAIRTALAFNYYLDREDKLALQQLNLINEESLEKIPLAFWVKGLVLWRQNDFNAAGEQFYELAQSLTNPATIARASFWAARCFLKTGEFHKVIPALKLAANQPRNFYGLLAMYALGQDINNVWETPVRPQDEITEEFSHPALTRFYALKQIGKNEWAEQELSKLYLEADEEAKKLLILVADANDFSDALQGLTGTLQGEETRYPMPNWCPVNDWQLDKALVFAFVRQESCFNHRAESSRGAIGLMQIMPKTGKELSSSINRSFSKHKLKDPSYNLALGQTYLKQLLESPNIQGNILWTAVAYNAGPGNLIKWEKKMHYDNDPLLFLESIPSKETRTFVERILMNYWVYRSLTNQNLNSLDQVVKGQWPIYQY